MRSATYWLMELAADHDRFGGGGLRGGETGRSTGGAGMRVLGLSAGNPDGSAEILLKLALQAAETEGAQTALVRLHDLSLPTRPVGPDGSSAADDGPWLWDQLMESDGLIVSTPIYSRTIAGTLKLVADRLAGPGGRRGLRRELPAHARGRARRRRSPSHTTSACFAPGWPPSSRWAAR